MTGRLAARLLRLASELRAARRRWHDPARRVATRRATSPRWSEHAPEREQAARPVRRRRAGPARARRDRHPRPGRARADRPPLSGQGRRSRGPRAGRRPPAQGGPGAAQVAAEEATVRRAVVPGGRRRPRRSRPCRRPRGRADRTARADVGARSRRARSVAGFGGQVESVRRAAAGPGRPRPRTSQARAAEQRRERAARRRSRRSPASSRAGRARSRSPRPGRLAGRPDVVAEACQDDASASSSSLDERPRPTVAGRPRAEMPDVDRLDPGVRRDDRVGRAEERLAEQLGHLRFADARPAGTSGRDRPHRGRAPRSRGNACRATSAASRAAGRAARRSPGRRAGRPTSPGAVPFGLGERLGRRDQPGLLEVELGERHAAPGPQLAQPRLEVGSTAGVSSQTAAIASRVRSSGSARGRRSRRPGRPAERVPECVLTAPRSSGSAVRRPTRTPAGQRPRELAGVRVAGLAARSARCRSRASRRWRAAGPGSAGTRPWPERTAPDPRPRRRGRSWARYPLGCCNRSSMDGSSSAASWTRRRGSGCSRSGSNGRSRSVTTRRSRRGTA